ncbi:uncharacterized [Tachysurus ichikawai]
MSSLIKEAMIESYALMILVMAAFFVYFCGMVWAFSNPKLSGSEDEEIRTECVRETGQSDGVSFELCVRHGEMRDCGGYKPCGRHGHTLMPDTQPYSGYLNYFYDVD